MYVCISVLFSHVNNVHACHIIVECNYLRIILVCACMRGWPWDIQCCVTVGACSICVCVYQCVYYVCLCIDDMIRVHCWVSIDE